MRRGEIRDPASQERLDEALAVSFGAPNSYTGEDVVELHVHGGAGVVAACLSAVLATGVRLAGPGEFTRRAFLNGRMDLAQAEAVADLIGSESALAARAAAARLAGALGRALRELRSQLLNALSEIEAHVDYPDEVPLPDMAALIEALTTQRARVAELLAGAGPATALRDGISCAIAGPPNAGKSSLLNALVDAPRAIVSNVPGTTRDIVEERVALDGVTLRLQDTAGLRGAADAIEAQGVSRARLAIAAATLVIVVIDASAAPSGDALQTLQATRDCPRIIVANKSDLGTAGVAPLRAAATADGSRPNAFISGSVLQAQTIGELRREIARLGWGGAVVDPQSTLVASGRQIEALRRADESLEAALATASSGLPVDLIAGDLRSAMAAFAQLTGEDAAEAVLDDIFARFCVGK